MTLSLYMDHQVPWPISNALRTRGVDVRTAEEDSRAELPDPAILARATTLGKILFTRDSDFWAMGKELQRQEIHFTGIIYVHQRDATVRQCVDALELLCKVYEPAEMENQVLRLPLL